VTAAKTQTKSDFNEFVLFSEEENEALDERSFERDARGKPVVYATCLKRGIDVQLKPEERTRQTMA
jgi:type I restriction enzyme M protein